jgi:hypothetical protein
MKKLLRSLGSGIKLPFKFLKKFEEKEGSVVVWALKGQ